MVQRIPVVLSTLSFVGVVVLLYVSLTTNPHPVYVDSNRLVNNYKGMIAARAEFEKKAQVWKSRVDTLSMELRAEIIEFEKSSPNISDRERGLRRELIRSKQKQVQDYELAVNEQAKSEDQRMTQAVLSEIDDYIEKFSQANGYHIVLAASPGNIAYAEKSLDLTDQILEGLNRSYSSK